MIASSLLPKPRSATALALPLALALMWVPVGSSAAVVDGVQLPDGVRRVGEGRYRSALTYEKTLEYFRTVYPARNHRRVPIINQPGVRAMHIAFPAGNKYAGLNVYEDKAGLREVRIFLVPRGSASKKR
ncbi:MAG TPA: hypothetical protein VK013_11480 [Myxococcaceae bacterium]|nr:hypothetical protein [Myxococcaceae bacterium]